MKTKLCMLFITVFSFLSLTKAQNTIADSTACANTLKSLLEVCKNVDLGDPKTTSHGSFYKAAPYIVYSGIDKKRAWKVFANYRNAEEKKAVDEICNRINGSVNSDGSYKIIRYSTENESEGKWHVLMVSYKKDGDNKTLLFAFLKIGNRYGLGDID